MRVRAPLLLLTFVCFPALCQAPVEVDVTPCFQGSVPSGGVMPFVLTLRNHGQSVSGAAVVDTGSQIAPRRYIYPISLPYGAIKRVMVYPRKSADGSSFRLRFEGRIKARDVDLDPSLHYTDSRLVGFIGDRFGAIFPVTKLSVPGRESAYPGGPPIRYRPGSGGPQAQSFADTYAKPEDAPDRPVGYENLAALVLADGCERLNPAQWNAIRHWVLGGGSLIVVGGAGATYARLPELRPLLPITNLESRSVGALGLTRAGDHLLQGRIAIVTGSPVPSAKVDVTSEGVPIVLSRPYGAGCVAYAAYSPLEQPLRGSGAVSSIWRELLGAAGTLHPAVSLWNMSLDEVGGPPMVGAPPMPGGAPMPGALAYNNSSATTGSNPFQISLPPIEIVVAVFLGYFILAVPFTYIVLKRRQRLEWAWITSPILSIGCAYVLYLFTASLYQAGMCRRTTGYLVSDAGSSVGRFAGSSELFFPHGGSYRLEADGVDTMEVTANARDVYYYSESTGQPLDTVDSGAVFAPEFNVGNLAFKRVYFSQAVGIARGITATLHAEPTGGFSGTLTNNTQLTLRNALIIWPEHKVFTNGVNLNPGGTEKVEASNTWDTRVLDTDGHIKPRPGHYEITYGHRGLPVIYEQFLGLANSSRHGALMLAQTDGESLGPRLGKYVGSSGGITVVVSLPAPKGGA